MGKGSRNSQQRLNNESAFEKFDTKKKKKGSSGKAVAIACMAFAVLIVAILVLNVLTETGLFIRMTDAMELNGVVVDGAMMSFFYNDYLMTFYNNYGGYLSYLSLDLSASLKLQQFPASGGLAGYILGEEYDGTWYDYFLDKVIENVEMYVTLCDAANKEGVKLDDEDRADIEESVKTIMDSVKSSYSSLSDWFGRGVNENDIRRCYEMITLASKYSEYKYEKLEEEIKAEEESGKDPVMDYIEENKGNFYTAEYLSYKIKVSEKNYKAVVYDQKVTEAKAWAEKIANAGSLEAFLNLVKEYEIENNLDDEDETTTGTETVDIEEAADEYRGTISYETETGTGDSLENWIFVEGASEGDGKIFEETATETVKKTETTTEAKTETATETDTGTETETEKEEKTSYRTYTVTAYYITKGSHLDTDLTNNFAFVISDKKENVESFLSQFKELTEKNAEIFNDKAEEFYEKLHEGHDHNDENATEPVFVYYNVEQMAKDFFNNNYFGIENDADAWIDAERKAGDLSEIFAIEIEETNSSTNEKEKKTYYVVVYFDGRDREEYYVNGFNGLVNERFDDWYKNDSSKKDIHYNKNAFDNINTIVLY